MLVAGLWPFHRPQNGVTWLPSRDGILISQHGTLSCIHSSVAGNAPEGSPFTIEAWIQPQETDDGGTIFAFHLSDTVRRFSVRQRKTDLEVRHELRDGYHLTQAHWTKIQNVFRKNVQSFVSITTGPQGTMVYIDGTLTNTAPALRLSTNVLAGRMVVGTSPVANDSWSGQLLGLAFYSQELTPARVLSHYHSWTSVGRPEITESDRNTSLYLFSERSGNTVHDSGSAGNDLVIPEHYVILHEKLLEPFWEEFDLHWSYWKSAIINVVGFVPFGFLFYAYFSSVRRITWAGLLTVLFGTAVSLTIEVLQSFLPTRDSGTTDLITNTLGTALGVAIYRWKPNLLSNALNRLCAL